MKYDLNRFIKAQEVNYQDALEEIRAGMKQSHWMWFIFPQIDGLGRSETARYYAIKDIEEARQYLKHPILGKNLIEISKALLEVDSDDASYVMGFPDDMKLKSSMTLFLEADPECTVFQQVLDKYFGGEKDKNTLRLL